MIHAFKKIILVIARLDVREARVEEWKLKRKILQEPRHEITLGARIR